MKKRKPANTVVRPSAPPLPAASKLSLPTLPAPQAPAAKVAPITIEATLDVGFGNVLFLRGEGAGLAWDRGVPLECVDGKTWRWSKATPEKITFKLLVNDQVWAAGDNLSAGPGQKLELVPAFA